MYSSVPVLISLGYIGYIFYTHKLNDIHDPLTFVLLCFQFLIEGRQLSMGYGHRRRKLNLERKAVRKEHTYIGIIVRYLFVKNIDIGYKAIQKKNSISQPTTWQDGIPYPQLGKYIL